MTLRDLFNKYNSQWLSCYGHSSVIVFDRIESLLQRDEASGFTRLPAQTRSKLVSLFNALDMTAEAGRAGTPPYHRMRCLSARDRILEG